MKKGLILLMLVLVLPAFALGDEHKKKGKAAQGDSRNRVVKNCQDACRNYGYTQDLLVKCTEWCQQCIADVGYQAQSGQGQVQGQGPSQ